MKRSMMILVAASLFSASVPAMAMDHVQMDTQQHDEQCQKDCDMMVKNCRAEVDSIQQKIEKLQSAIRNNADKYSREQLSKLNDKLEDAQRTLANIEKGGA